jgi:hypothetical protein
LAEADSDLRATSYQRRTKCLGAMFFYAVGLAHRLATRIDPPVQSPR